MEVLNVLIPPLLIGLCIWLTAISEHGTTLNLPLCLPGDVDELIKAIQGEEQISTQSPTGQQEGVTATSS